MTSRNGSNPRTAVTTDVKITMRADAVNPESGGYALPYYTNFDSSQADSDSVAHNAPSRVQQTKTQPASGVKPGSALATPVNHQVHLSRTTVPPTAAPPKTVVVPNQQAGFAPTDPDTTSSRVCWIVSILVLILGLAMLIVGIVLLVLGRTQPVLFATAEVGNVGGPILIAAGGAAIVASVILFCCAYRIGRRNIKKVEKQVKNTYPRSQPGKTPIKTVSGRVMINKPQATGAIQTGRHPQATLEVRPHLLVPVMQARPLPSKNPQQERYLVSTMKSPPRNSHQHQRLASAGKAYSHEGRIAAGTLVEARKQTLQRRPDQVDGTYNTGTVDWDGHQYEVPHHMVSTAISGGDGPQQSYSIQRFITLTDLSGGQRRGSRDLVDATSSASTSHHNGSRAPSSHLYMNDEIFSSPGSAGSGPIPRPRSRRSDTKTDEADDEGGGYRQLQSPRAIQPGERTVVSPPVTALPPPMEVILSPRYSSSSSQQDSTVDMRETRRRTPVVDIQTTFSSPPPTTSRHSLVVKSMGDISFPDKHEAELRIFSLDNGQPPFLSQQIDRQYQMAQQGASSSTTTSDTPRNEGHSRKKKGSKHRITVRQTVHSEI